MDMPMPELLVDPARTADAQGPDGVALACVLEYAAGEQIALPIHAGVELVEQPRVTAVPGMPHFCLGLLAWQGQRLPLVDLQAYLQAWPGALPLPGNPSHVLVVAYQAARGEPIEYGAFCAPKLVRMVQVSDEQQCPLPTGNPIWPRVAMSCFLHQGQAVPVLDPAHIFARPAPAGTL